MKTLFDVDVREDIQARIGRVTPATQARWGAMNAERMLSHLAESLKMALGEVSCKPKRLPIRFFPLKQLLIYVVPFAKGLPTAPELLTGPLAPLDDLKSEIGELMTKFASRRDAGWPDHPAFGKLSAQGWGVLTRRHFDHHLRQFGV